MLKIKLNCRNHSYPIYIANGLISHAELIRSHIRADQVLIVTDVTVAQYYLDDLKTLLNNYQCDHVILEQGEQHKTFGELDQLLTTLLEHNHHRDTTIIALGGGVITDIAGLAASLYQRGVSLLQIPTSLLAQIDAAIGGKTAVNHRLAKNMVGTFYHPRCVMIDPQVLTTLNKRRFCEGFAEMVKYSLLAKDNFFAWLEQHHNELLKGDLDYLEQAIYRCCVQKAELVSQDENDLNQRLLLNLGHTFAHAIEAMTHYQRYTHGEAVSIGLCLAAELSRRLDFLDESVCLRLQQLLRHFNLPTQLPKALACSGLFEFMARDKKVQAGQWRFVLLRGVGDAFVTSALNRDMLEKYLLEGT